LRCLADHEEDFEFQVASEAEEEDRFRVGIMSRAKMEQARRFIINRDGIGFFKAILESYEDLGIFSVIDGKDGLIELIYSSDFEDDIQGIVNDMLNCGIELREVARVR